MTKKNMKAVNHHTITTNTKELLLVETNESCCMKTNGTLGNNVNEKDRY